MIILRSYSVLAPHHTVAERRCTPGQGRMYSINEIDPIKGQKLITSSERETTHYPAFIIHLCNLVAAVGICSSFNSAVAWVTGHAVGGWTGVYRVPAQQALGSLLGSYQSCTVAVRVAPRTFTCVHDISCPCKTGSQTSCSAPL